MRNGKADDLAIKHIGDYVGNRLAGKNKQDSALASGYSESTARKPSLIEGTKTYNIIVEQILTENASTMYLLASSINEDAKNGLFDSLKPLEKASLYKIITDTNDKLAPKVTMKQSTDAKGNKTTTAWGTNASMLHEAIGS